MKLTLDVENTVTTRDGKLHLDPFETENELVMVGCLTDKGEQYLFRENFEGVQELQDPVPIHNRIFPFHRWNKQYPDSRGHLLRRNSWFDYI